MRDFLVAQLDTSIYLVSDTLHNVEHSLEALVPFLQYYNRDVQIVPILVPAMSFDRMQEIAAKLAESILQITQKKQFKLGKELCSCCFIRCSSLRQ